MLDEIVHATQQKFSIGSLPGEECSQTGWCLNPSHGCYRKHELWAECLASCTPGIHDNEPLKARTPWSCEQIRPSFPEKAIAVKSGPMKGLCLTSRRDRDAPVTFEPCVPQRSHPWLTRTGRRDFDLWLAVGLGQGLAIRPAHCAQRWGVLGVPATVQGNCQNFGLRWSDSRIELTKDGERVGSRTGPGLCLDTDLPYPGKAGSAARWTPCSQDSLRFEEH